MPFEYRCKRRKEIGIPISFCIPSNRFDRPCGDA
jgi:hypothetical protein